MTGGQCLHIDLSDAVESNRLKALANDVLDGKRSMADNEIASVRRHYNERVDSNL
jgi:hypothetical protein